MQTNWSVNINALEHIFRMEENRRGTEPRTSELQIVMINPVSVQHPNKQLISYQNSPQSFSSAPVGCVVINVYSLNKYRPHLARLTLISLMRCNQTFVDLETGVSPQATYCLITGGQWGR